MQKKLENPKGAPLLDIASFARRGPHGAQLSSAQLEQIQRTVRRVPEVMVKVLPRGSNDFKAAGKHLDYIGREGELALETDDGQDLQKQVGKSLLEDWDLDLDDVRQQAGLTATNGRKPPKLIHKLIFSMPPGTPPDKVLGAVRNFAREQLALKHRYAFVLHTDEPHPHVHLVMKAVSEQGVRLNIKKAMLRYWRSEFARHLRLLGVAANATERAVRGESRSPKKDGIYRADQRGDSTYIRKQAETVAAQFLKGKIAPEPGAQTLAETRRRVEAGWRNAIDMLVAQGKVDMATEVQCFLDKMSPPRTQKEWAAESNMSHARTRTNQPVATR